MSDFCSPDNPYNPKARNERDAERKHRKAFYVPLPRKQDCNFPPIQEYSDTVDVNSDEGILIAKACQVRVVEDRRKRRREDHYNIKVPAPPLHPFHELENPFEVRMRFDEAVKLDREWIAKQRKHWERN